MEVGSFVADGRSCPRLSPLVPLLCLCLDLRVASVWKGGRDTLKGEWQDLHEWTVDGVIHWKERRKKKSAEDINYILTIYVRYIF